MKHIFGVMSPLTFFLTKKIVEVHQLAPKDCILLLTRDYQIPREYNSMFPNQIATSYNVSINQGRIFMGLNLFKTLQNVHNFDKIIDNQTKSDDFLWYTSVCSNDICSLMITKTNCKGYYILEDGLSSYRPFNPKTFKGLRNIIYHCLLKPIFPRIFAVKDRFINTDSPKFIGCIATNKRCFPLHQEHLEIIGMPFPIQKLNFQPDAIISIEGTYEFIADDKIRQIYTKLAEYIKGKGYKNITYKLHPRFFSSVNKAHKADYENMLIDIFGTHIKPLAQDCSLESLLQTYHSDFYTGNSSVAIYASAMGCNCYSYINDLCQLSNFYKQFQPLMTEYCTIINL